MRRRAGQPAWDAEGGKKARAAFMLCEARARNGSAVWRRLARERNVAQLCQAHPCTHMHAHTRTHARTPPHLCVHAPASVHAHTRTHARTHLLTCTTTPTPTHAHTHTHLEETKSQHPFGSYLTRPHRSGTQWLCRLARVPIAPLPCAVHKILSQSTPLDAAFALSSPVSHRHSLSPHITQVQRPASATRRRKAHLRSSTAAASFRPLSFAVSSRMLVFLSG